jgi:hypothetical protein
MGVREFRVVPGGRRGSPQAVVGLSGGSHDVYRASRGQKPWAQENKDPFLATANQPIQNHHGHPQASRKGQTRAGA